MKINTTNLYIFIIFILIRLGRYDSNMLVDRLYWHVVLYSHTTQQSS